MGSLVTIFRGSGILAALWLGLALMLAAAPASASRTQESMFQDDILLVYGADEEVRSTLDELGALGVDRLRVSVFWGIVAPDPTSRERPSFDATDPAAYPPQNWARYDRLVREAAARGLKVNLGPTGPAPLWATGVPDTRPDVEAWFEPSPAEYGAFVEALGRRYSGSYVPPLELPPGPPPERGGEGGLIPALGELFGSSSRDAQAAQGPGPPLPRIDFWSAWNEPNQPGWLTPQWVPTGNGGQVEAAPRIYRDLFQAFWAALQRTGHGGDQILAGDLAPRGTSRRGKTRAIKALRFIRAMYCVDRRFRPLRGAAAEALGCPAEAGALPGTHPGLFRITGFAHHPYHLIEAPSARSRDREYATIADAPRLHRTLRGIWRNYRQGGTPPVWYTEYGYQTRPPDPTGVPESRQAAWLNEAEFMAYRDPRVRSHAQFLLVDDKPRPGVDPSDPRYWGTFQTGIRHIDGRAKRSYAAYRMPIHLPRRTLRRPGSLRVWGKARPATRGRRHSVRVEFRARGQRRWRTIRRLRTSGHRFVDSRVRFTRSGQVRLAATVGGRTIRSRAVAVRVRRR